MATLAPMEARSVERLPVGGGWQYEPKWDGFRGLAMRDGAAVDLRSKAGQPLGRYFPEVVDALKALAPTRFVLDGELVVPVGGAFSFDALLQRIHPAESRVRRLAAETPATYVVFDLLGDASGAPLLALPLAERRGRLEAFAAKWLQGPGIRLSPATTDLAAVRAWTRDLGGDLDGIVAKRLDAAYDAGGRDAMVKVKALRTADCVVGGFRYGEGSREVGSLLLGLYGGDGLLHHVGFCSGLRASEKPALTRRLEALVAPPGFTGRAPGGPSRWSTARSAEWQPLRPELVVEVRFDHVSANRFRHGTGFVRWRPDKDPRQCTMDQLRQKAGALPVGDAAARLAPPPSSRTPGGTAEVRRPTAGPRPKRPKAPGIRAARQGPRQDPPRAARKAPAAAAQRPRKGSASGSSRAAKAPRAGRGLPPPKRA